MSPSLNIAMDALTGISVMDAYNLKKKWILEWTSSHNQKTGEQMGPVHAAVQVSSEKPAPAPSNRATRDLAMEAVPEPRLQAEEHVRMPVPESQTGLGQWKIPDDHAEQSGGSPVHPHQVGLQPDVPPHHHQQVQDPLHGQQLVEQPSRLRRTLLGLAARGLVRQDLLRSLLNLEKRQAS